MYALQISEYQQSLVPNTYTAMAPYLGAQPTATAPELHVIEGPMYAGNLRVSTVGWCRRPCS